MLSDFQTAIQKRPRTKRTLPRWLHAKYYRAARTHLLKRVVSGGLGWHDVERVRPTHNAGTAASDAKIN